jgi:hypothetical protein
LNHLWKKLKKARAYIQTTAQHGPSQQLLDFINYDGSLGSDIGLESFDNFSTLAQHELLSNKLDPARLEAMAVQSIFEPVNEALSDMTMRGQSLDELYKSLYTPQYNFSGSTVSELMSTSSTEAITIEFDSNYLGLESIMTKIKETTAQWSAKILSMAKHIGDLITIGLKKVYDKIMDKLKALLDKIKNNKLVKTIKAHPVKSVLLVIATIATIATVIYLYTKFNKGYSAAEIKHYEIKHELQMKLHAAEQDFINQKGRTNNLLGGIHVAEHNHKNAIVAANPIGPPVLLKHKAELSKLESELELARSERNKILVERSKWFNDGLTRSAKTQQDLTAMGSKSHADFELARSLRYEKELQTLRDLADHRVSAVSRPVDAKINIIRKLEEEQASILAELPKTEAEVARYKQAYESSKKLVTDKLNITKKINEDILSNYNSWDHERRSFYTRVHETLNGTFLSFNAKDAVLSSGTKIPHVKFAESFPPKPMDGTTSSLGWTTSGVNSIQNAMSGAWGKLSSSVKDFGGFVFSHKANLFSSIGSSIHFVYGLLRDVIGRALGMIMSSVSHVSTAAA